MQTQIRLDGRSPQGPLEDGIGFARILPHANDDLLVVNAARGSMGKQHDTFDPVIDGKLIQYLAAHQHWTPFAQPQFVYVRELPLEEFILWCVQTQYYQMSRMLLGMSNHRVWFLERGSFYAYLQAGLAPYRPDDVQHSLLAHFGDAMVPCVKALADLTPFMHSESDLHEVLTAMGYYMEYDELADFLVLTLHVKMPIFVERQYFKHQILFNRNSISGRYVALDEFYQPQEYRVQPASVKQGSLDEVHELNDLLVDMGSSTTAYAGETYRGMIDQGVAKEQARVHLPLSTYTTFIETVPVSGLRRMVKQRTDRHAQREIQAYGHLIGRLAQDTFPQTWACLE